MNKVKVNEACRIARLERHRLNEAVSLGWYTEAPKVVRGSTRMFDEVEVLGLVMWSLLRPLKRRVGVNKAIRRAMERARAGDLGLVFLPEPNPAEPLLCLVTIRFDLSVLMDYVLREMQNGEPPEARLG
jgi:hypothetical protein